LEPEILYYRRRACEEMTAASRAVTQAARERRLYMVDLYLGRLKALHAPSPIDDQRLELMREGKRNLSAFAWAGKSAGE
jgi:hypothetical protein